MKLKPRMGFKRLGLLITLVALLSTYFIMSDSDTDETTVGFVIVCAILAVLLCLYLRPQRKDIP